VNSSRVDQLVAEHLDLVAKVLSRHDRHRADYDDRYSDGLLGLWRAARTYDDAVARAEGDGRPAFCFVTHARKCIAQDIGQAAKRRDTRCVRASSLDAHTAERPEDFDPGLAVVDVDLEAVADRTAARALAVQLGATPDEIGLYADLPVTTIADRRGTSRQAVYAHRGRVEQRLRRCARSNEGGSRHGLDH
jgi:hypothetical protein